MSGTMPEILSNGKLEVMELSFCVGQLGRGLLFRKNESN